VKKHKGTDASKTVIQLAIHSKSSASAVRTPPSGLLDRGPQSSADAAAGASVEATIVDDSQPSRLPEVRHDRPMHIQGRSFENSLVTRVSAVGKRLTLRGHAD
jgi:hypothetical protein